MIKDDQMLVMKRNKFGNEYYTLIGGKIDIGETPEQALMREVREETGMAIKDPRLVLVEEAGNPFGTQYIYLCDYVYGEPKLDTASIEHAIGNMGQNLYEPMWLPIKDLEKSPFRSETLKQSLLEFIPDKFPDTPQTLHTREDIRYTNANK